MATTTIRLDAELLKAAKKLHINVSEAARMGIEEAIRRQRIVANIQYLASIAVKPKEPSEVTIRRHRDGGRRRAD
ncbi:MAG: type II toxin-antitoxin system CcdA family antitoxin [Candidatus Thermoplasmatota archaeon]